MNVYIPPEIQAGDSLHIEFTSSDYPASAGWVATLSLRGASVLDVDSTAVADTYSLDASATQTATLEPGSYAAVVTVAKDGERHTLAKAGTSVLPDILTQAAGYDGRTHVQKTLAAIEAVLEGTASKEQEEYEVQGRRMKYRSIPDLITLRDQYRAERKNEINAERLAQGLSSNRIVHVRMP